MNTTMKGWIPFILLLLATSPGLAAKKPVNGVGFTCVSPKGTYLRLNVDLAAKRFQEEGEGPKNIKRIDDRTITLVHYSTVSDGVYLVEKIDRVTLLYTLQVVDPQGELQTVDYQCSMGPAFDFTAGRKF